MEGFNGLNIGPKMDYIELALYFNFFVESFKYISAPNFLYKDGRNLNDYTGANWADMPVAMRLGRLIFSSPVLPEQTTTIPPYPQRKQA